MKVGLFPTCLVAASAPEIAIAARRLLERQGHDVVLLEAATCCGQPAWNSGQRDAARPVAGASLRAFVDADVDAVVIPSGSCTAMIRDYWPQLFAGDTTPAPTVATALDRTMELTEFLAANAAEPVEAAARAEGVDEVLYHPSCHMTRLLGLVDAPRTTLERAGFAPTSHAATGRCCGFGGLFSIKFPELSVAMADDVLDGMVGTETTTVTGCDLSCLLQLASRAEFRGLDLRFVHVAQLVAGRDHGEGQVP
jgi:L-lactate dehydrogenase complex protein LldE